MEQIELLVYLSHPLRFDCSKILRMQVHRIIRHESLACSLTTFRISLGLLLMYFSTLFIMPFLPSSFPTHVPVRAMKRTILSSHASHTHLIKSLSSRGLSDHQRSNGPLHLLPPEHGLSYAHGISYDALSLLV